MPKYDVFLKGKKVKVSKNLTEVPSKMDGFDYVGSLVGSTKVNALTQAKAKVKSGLLSVEEVQETQSQSFKVPISEKPKKAIYCDFNGVIEDPEREANSVNSSHEESFYLPEIACPHKIFKLIKLAVDTNADLILSSMWRLRGMDWYIIVYRSLMKSGVEEYKEYVKDNLEKIQDLCAVPSTESLDNRSNEIEAHVKYFNYTHFVVFEDYEFIGKHLNPIMVNSSEGLLDNHIEKAYELLK